MGKLLEIVSPLHQSTERDYLARMNDHKTRCMEIARQYGKDYWDGDRRYGYGGYKFIPGRWRPVAEALIDRFNLTSESRVLDVGCGKGYLLYEIAELKPGIDLSGFDVSNYGLNAAHPDIKAQLFVHEAQREFPFDNNSFDLVISLGCLHNLRLPDVEIALKEIERVGQSGYVMVESYRSESELTNLQCWALTAESFFDPEEWTWLYKYFGYTGDYEFIYFE